MKIRNKIILPFPEDRIWGFIADPVLMKLWNPRIKEVVPVTLGKPRANSQYRIRYRLGSRESNYLAEIMEYEEFSRLVLHLEGGNLPKKGFIQEIYELSSGSKGTLLIQNILIEHGGLSVSAGLKMRFNNRIGRSSAKKYLMKLRNMAEGGQ